MNKAEAIRNLEIVRDVSKAAGHQNCPGMLQGVIDWIAVNVAPDPPLGSFRVLIAVARTGNGFVSAHGVDEVAPEQRVQRAQIAMRYAEEQFRDPSFGGLVAKALIEAYIPCLAINAVAGKVVEVKP